MKKSISALTLVFLGAAAFCAGTDSLWDAAVGKAERGRALVPACTIAVSRVLDGSGDVKRSAKVTTRNEVRDGKLVRETVRDGGRDGANPRIVDSSAEQYRNLFSGDGRLPFDNPRDLKVSRLSSSSEEVSYEANWSDEDGYRYRGTVWVSAVSSAPTRISYRTVGVPGGSAIRSLEADIRYAEIDGKAVPSERKVRASVVRAALFRFTVTADMTSTGYFDPGMEEK